jgi:hypothetical protein
MTQRVLLVSIVLLSVLSGCAGSAPKNDMEISKSKATASTTHSQCETASISYSGSNDSVRTQTLDSNTLRLGYGLPANASVLFVAYENGTVLGVKHVTTESSVAATGVTFSLNTQLSGTHTVNVVVYEDTNENGDFDPNVDTICRHNGKTVQTGADRFNFSGTDSE